MNIFVRIVIKFTVGIWLLLSSSSLSAHISEHSERNYVSIGDKPQVELIATRLNNMSSDLDITFDKEVYRRILEYTVHHRRYTEQLLGRAVVHFPVFEQKLRENDMPQDLKYIPVVESLLKPQAKSKMGAYGLWQFIKSTGRVYDLQINAHIDERADPVLATDAAIEFFKDLYKQFGDWTLVVAAYNSGPGHVRRAIRKSGSKDFWKLRKYLPRETRNYVPRIIAAAYLMNYYHEHGLYPAEVDNVFDNVIEVVPTKNVSLVKLSTELNVDLELLRSINTKHNTDQIVAKQATFRLPASRLYHYYKLYDVDKLPTYIQEREKIQPTRKLPLTDSLARVRKIYANIELDKEISL